MARIQVGDGESLDKALRRFKKLCSNEGVLALSKRGAHFEKPSDQRRREHKERLKTIRIVQGQHR